MHLIMAGIENEAHDLLHLKAIEQRKQFWTLLKH